MAKQKIAITIPPETLNRIDAWAEKLEQSRSRFILEQIETQLRNLEDAEVTKLYNEVYQSSEALEKNKALAKEIGQIASVEEEKW